MIILLASGDSSTPGISRRFLLRKRLGTFRLMIGVDAIKQLGRDGKSGDASGLLSE